MLAILAVVVLNVPVTDTLLGMQAWERQAPYREGERWLAQGNADSAVTSFRAADMNIADTRYGLAAALLWNKEVDEALSVLRPNEPEDRYEPPILRGHAARMLGNPDHARSFFNARVVQVAGDEALRWAWDHLRPELVQSIDVGSGLDVGYVRGFHGPEADAEGRPFRWSKDVADVRGLSSGVCWLEWNGWRPSGLQQAQVALTLPNPYPSSAVPPSITLSNSPEWTISELVAYLGPIDFTEDRLELGVNSFVISGSDPRLVGVQVTRVNACLR
jgi:hypothetical protein